MTVTRSAWTRHALLRLGLLTGVAAGISPALHAQAPGTIAVGGFGQRTAFDEQTTLTFGTAPGVGGFIGVFALPNFAVEAGASYTWTYPSEPPRIRATWVPLRARAVYHVPVTENFYPFAGVGVVHNRYAEAVDGSDTGLGLLLGIKTYLSERVAFRSDLNLDLVSAPFNEGTPVGGLPIDEYANWSFTAGISVDLRGGRFKDSDGDGVRDRSDLCPNTPIGVGIDANGCRLDEDRDGVFDENDLCPLTPPGVQVDATGCRIDTDADRVFDEDDLCPGTPMGVTVDGSGCPIDSDGDRVVDHLDACPATPLGASVDATGCRIDTDDDGVWDEDDLCAGTASGVAVDPDGCPVLFEEEQVVLVLTGVTFDTWSSALSPQAQQILDEVAEALVARPDVRIRVNGHTDSSGARQLNLDLSQDRADAVRDYLVDQGVPSDQLEAHGFGPDLPIATNDTPEGRQENRRVELERIDQGG